MFYYFYYFQQFVIISSNGNIEDLFSRTTFRRSMESEWDCTLYSQLFFFSFFLHVIVS